MEQSGGQRRQHAGAGVDRAGRLAAQCDAARIAPEGLDVALDPAQHGLLVQDAVIAERVTFAVQRWVGKESEQAQPVIHRHDDSRAAVGPAGGELAAVVVARLAVDVSTAVDPHDHRVPLAVVGEIRREDVQVQAVLVDAARTREGAQFRHLRAGACEPGRIAWRAPMLDRLRRPPAQLTHRGRGVGNAEEGAHSIADEPLDGAFGAPDDRPVGPRILFLRAGRAGDHGRRQPGTQRELSGERQRGWA